MKSQRVAIIGGGIVGCMIARKILDEKPATCITLIDSGLIGSGASQYSAGVHFPVGCSERVKALSIYSSRYYEEMQVKNPNLPIYPVSFLVAASYLNSEEVNSRCIGLQPLPAKEIPNELTNSLLRACFWDMPNCHVADVYSLVQILASELRNRLQLLEGIKVINISERYENVLLTLSSGMSMDFDRVILAPGPWVNTLPFQAFTEQLGIRTKKVVALHLEQPPQLDKAIFFPIEDLFLTPLPYRRHWLLSYTCQHWNVHPADCLHDNVTIVELNEVRELLNQYIPQCSPLVISGRVFCDAYSSNREPIIATVGQFNRVIFAGASNGAGYRLAPGIANEVINLLIKLEI